MSWIDPYHRSFLWTALSAIATTARHLNWLRCSRDTSRCLSMIVEDEVKAATPDSSARHPIRRMALKKTVGVCRSAIRHPED